MATDFLPTINCTCFLLPLISGLTHLFRIYDVYSGSQAHTDQAQPTHPSSHPLAHSSTLKIAHWKLLSSDNQSISQSIDQNICSGLSSTSRSLLTWLIKPIL